MAAGSSVDSFRFRLAAGCGSRSFRPSGVRFRTCRPSARTFSLCASHLPFFLHIPPVESPRWDSQVEFRRLARPAVRIGADERGKAPLTATFAAERKKGHDVGWHRQLGGAATRRLWRNALAASHFERLIRRQLVLPTSCDRLAAPSDRPAKCGKECHLSAVCDNFGKTFFFFAGTECSEVADGSAANHGRAACRSAASGAAPAGRASGRHLGRCVEQADPSPEQPRRLPDGSAGVSFCSLRLPSVPRHLAADAVEESATLRLVKRKTIGADPETITSRRRRTGDASPTGGT
jgi:hypothetical protein